MLRESVANLFGIIFRPREVSVYRGPRMGRAAAKVGRATVVGRHAYSATPVGGCDEEVWAEPGILKAMVQNYLKRAIHENAKFFDTRGLSLSGSIAGDLLHREDTFSVAKSFDLRVVYHQDDMYLAILARQRLYNRLQLREVVELLGRGSINAPHAALCFVGRAGKEAWQDCEILDVEASGRVLVRVWGLAATQMSVARERVIPKLSLDMIKRLLSLKGSRTNIDALLKKLRAPKGISEGQHLYEACEAIRVNYIQPMFPTKFGESELDLESRPADLVDVGGEIISGQLDSVVRPSGGASFRSIRELLKSRQANRPVRTPVILFCTPRTKSTMAKLVTELNQPSAGVGGFAGMPSNFNIRIEAVAEDEYVSQGPEGYIQLAERAGISPDPERRTALALVALSHEDETFEERVPLYYRLKGLFAHCGRPSQVIDPKTVSNKYAYWNIALNLAAKLGVVPWTLEDAAVLEPVDLFLGFSYSLIRSEELGTRRNIAYVNVFGADGAWKLFYSDDDLFSFEERLRRFPSLAADAVRSATDAPTKLGVVEVHYSKRFGLLERRAIAQGVRAVAPKAAVIFVSVNQDHPVRFFDRKNRQMTCVRGSLLRLDDETAYVQTLEADTWPGAGHPRPLRVRVYREFCTLQEDALTVSRRMLALTRLNWRSVREYSGLPVTILYSHLVARLSNYFSFLEWKKIDHNLKRTPWFL